MLNDRRAIAMKIKEKASDAGRTFAFHFFLRYGDYTNVEIARDCPLARQFFTLAASEALAGPHRLDAADRRLLTEYALAAVEVAFNERLQALAAHNANHSGYAGGVDLQLECSHEA
jgi:hypothetical protein